MRTVILAQKATYRDYKMLLSVLCGTNWIENYLLQILLAVLGL